MSNTSDQQKDGSSFEKVLVESLKHHLMDQGFEIKPVAIVDILATKGPDQILIEFKAPKAGYVTLDTIAQVRSLAKECNEKFGMRVKPIVLGNFTTTGSSQSIAAANNVHLVKITPEMSADDLGRLVDAEINKAVTDVT